MNSKSSESNPSPTPMRNPLFGLCWAQANSGDGSSIPIPHRIFARFIVNRQLDALSYGVLPEIPWRTYLQFHRPSQYPTSRFCLAIGTATHAIFKYRWIEMRYKASKYLIDQRWGRNNHSPSYRETSARRHIVERYYRHLDLCHRKCAKAIVKRLKHLGGVYAKVGQFMLSFDHLLPENYMTLLRSLTDDLRPSKDILGVVASELKSLGFETLDSVFETVNPSPFAVGSIAQVHWARIHGLDQPVCLKVQHPMVPKQMKGDFKALEAIIQLVQGSFPDLRIISVFKRLNTALAQECDFRQEAFNSIRYQTLLASSLTAPQSGLGWDLTISIKRFWNEHIRGLPSVKLRVPEVYWPLCTERLMIMEYVEEAAAKRADRFLGKDSSEWAQKVREHVADCYMDATTKMLFRTGFLHCDMHLGNVLFNLDRDECDGRGLVTVFIIDHGMMRRMENLSRRAIVCLAGAQSRNNISEGTRILTQMEWVPPKMDVDQVFSTIGLLFNESEMIDGSFDQLLNQINLSVHDEWEQHPATTLNSAVIRGWMSFLQKLPTDVYWFIRAVSLTRHIHRSLGGKLNARLGILGTNALQYGGLSPWHDHLEREQDMVIDLETIRAFMTAVISAKNWPIARPRQRSIESCSGRVQRFTAGRFDLPPLLWTACPDFGTRTLNYPTMEEAKMFKMEHLD